MFEIVNQILDKSKSIRHRVYWLLLIIFVVLATDTFSPFPSAIFTEDKYSSLETMQKLLDDSTITKQDKEIIRREFGEVVRRQSLHHYVMIFQEANTITIKRINNLVKLPKFRDSKIYSTILSWLLFIISGTFVIIIAWLLYLNNFWRKNIQPLKDIGDLPQDAVLKIRKVTRQKKLAFLFTAFKKEVITILSLFLVVDYLNVYVSNYSTWAIILLEITLQLSALSGVFVATMGLNKRAKSEVKK